MKIVSREKKIHTKASKTEFFTEWASATLIPLCSYSFLWLESSFLYLAKKKKKKIHSANPLTNSELNHFLCAPAVLIIAYCHFISFPHNSELPDSMNFLSHVCTGCQAHRLLNLILTDSKWMVGIYHMTHWNLHKINDLETIQWYG